MRDRATEMALFRYALIREAADPALSTRQRGRLVREVASRPHPHPDGVEVTLGRSTLDQWIRAWRAGGFEALMSIPRFPGRFRLGDHAIAETAVWAAS